MAINIIAAIGKNNELGKEGKLIWSIPEDLKFFREITWGHDIIMGRKTFESLPNLLKGRRHIVLTRSKEFIPNVLVFDDIEKIIKNYQEKDAFVIGGGTIYKQFLNHTKNMYLTLIDKECNDADTYFPDFNEQEFDKINLNQGFDEKLNIKYKHVLYKRR